jgi:hypothetical protein
MGDGSPALYLRESRFHLLAARQNGSAEITREAKEADEVKE